MREPEPMEQIDYGIGYKGMLSPQQHMTLKVEGGNLAIALSLLALGGVVVGAILLPGLIDSKATASSAFARQTAQEAERESRIAIEQVDYMRVELAKKGVIVPSKH
jgi:hypothetical protein